MPEMTFEKLLARGPNIPGDHAAEIIESIQISAKYEGYLKRQMDQVTRLKDLETRPIPEGINFKIVSGLGREAVEKLGKHRPRTFGQALRLDGVTPADLSLLAVYLTQHGYVIGEAVAGE
jgi:tRNA uridine 5-carboxymethylaminomethyl modification enzyme